MDSTAHWFLEAVFIALLIFCFEMSLLNSVFGAWECRPYPSGERLCKYVVTPPDLGL